MRSSLLGNCCIWHSRLLIWAAQSSLGYLVSSPQLCQPVFSLSTNMVTQSRESPSCGRWLVPLICGLGCESGVIIRYNVLRKKKQIHSCRIWVRGPISKTDWGWLGQSWGRWQLQLGSSEPLRMVLRHYCTYQGIFKGISWLLCSRNLSPDSIFSLVRVSHAGAPAPEPERIVCFPPSGCRDHSNLCTGI